MTGKDVVLLYQLEQIPLVEQYLKSAAAKPRIVAFDFWIERELSRRGVAYESFRLYRLGGEELARWHAAAQNIAREWYRLPAMEFFAHRGIPLGEAVEPAVEAYLHTVLYHFVPLRNLLQTCDSEARILVPHSVQDVPPTSGAFTFFELSAVLNLVRLLAQGRGLTVVELGQAPRGKIEPFPPRSLGVRLLTLWNVLIGVLAPHRPLKLFASETWTHIEPFVPLMDDAELLLMDRKEIRYAPFKELWSHRMRFIHPLDAQSRSLRRIAADARSQYAHTWQQVRPAVAQLPELTQDEISLWPMIAPALDFFVTTYVERLVFETEAFAQIYERYAIQKVLLRASVSGRQPHFFIASKVAMAMGIPSIELQHAGAVLDPNSVHSRMEASYLAGYGTLTRDIYCKNHGYAPERMRPIGSPRFDRYLSTSPLTPDERTRYLREIALDPARPVVLVVVPADVVGLMPHNFDSYANVDLFNAMVRLQEALPEIQILFKFRPGNYSRALQSYLQELFTGEKKYAATDDDLFFRIRMSDVVISHNSTAMYETMIARAPLVLYPWRRNDIATPVYKQAAPMVFDELDLVTVVRRILADVSYRGELVEQGGAFLAKNYSFDGHSSERIVALLREKLSV